MLLILKVGQVKQQISSEQIAEIAAQLWHCPKVMLNTLQQDAQILRLSELFVEKQHCLFLVAGHIIRLHWKGH